MDALLVDCCHVWGLVQQSWHLRPFGPYNCIKRTAIAS